MEPPEKRHRSEEVLSRDTLRVASRVLSPEEIMFGAIWISPGGGPRGDGDRPDPGQSNADATVAAAVAAGIQDFDTAPWYGAGASEERLGRAVAALPSGSAKANVRLITKAGRLYREPPGGTEPCLAGFDGAGRASLHDRVCVNDFTAQGARVSLSESLNRMALPSVFGLRIHDPNDNSCNTRGMESYVDEVAIALGEEGMCAGLRKLREEKAIQHVSLGMNCNREAHQGVPEEILRLLHETPAGTFDSALLAGGWNLLTQAGLPCYLECQKQNIEVHVAGVFCSGLLAASKPGGGTYAYKTAPSEIVAKAERWRELAAKHGCSLPAVAIAFAALPACVSRVVLGFATPQQVAETIAWVRESGRVPSSIWAEAKNLGLIEERIPVPL